MVRHVENSETFTVNVKLKDGTVFLNKDITAQPQGKYERGISFWIDEKTIRFYPLEQIEYFEYVTS